jgi:two-component system cell cycle response regulator
MNNKILTVDDSRTIRLIIQRAFRGHECVIFEAANGEEGLAAAARELPALIILDITMPVMDGVTMLSKLKQIPGLMEIPVIMLTAESSQETVERLKKLGAQDHLTKPFRDGQLMEKVARIIQLPMRVPAMAV